MPGTDKKAKLKSKGLNDLMKFPSMSQITGGDLSGREGRENARAVELENQYLKNQVKAL